MTRLVGLVVAGLLLATSCESSTGPTEDDLLEDAAELTYPGATETSRSFRDEDGGRNVDGGEIRVAARLTRELDLDAPTPSADLVAFYDDELTAAGWTAQAHSSDNAAEWENEVEGRRHSYRVEIGTGSGPLDSYTTYYTIDMSGG